MSHDDEYEYIEEEVDGNPTTWGCLIAIFSPAALCGVLLFGSILFCNNTVSGVFNGFGDLLASIGRIFNVELFGSSTTVFSGPAVVQRVRPLGQLITTRVELAQSRIEVGTRYGIACYIGALHSAQGFVEAGINFDAFNADDVVFDEAKGEYLIRLPAPTVTNCYLDPQEMIKYHDWGATVACPANWDEMRRIASYEAVIKFRDRSVEEGIIQKAQEQADIVVSNFVASLTGFPTRIEFVPSESISYPATCMPQPPRPWRYDEAGKQWVRD